MKSISKKVIAVIVGGVLLIGSLAQAEDPGSELLPNPSFDSTADGWWLWCDSGGGASAGVSRDPITYDTAPAGCKIECTNPGSTFYSIQFNTNNLSITNGQKYRLTFRTKSTIPFTIPAIRLMKAGNPFNDYCDFHTNWSVEVRDRWSLYTIEYLANATATDARITFALGLVFPAGATLSIDSVSFRAKIENQLLLNPSFDDTTGWWLWGDRDSGGVVTGSRDTVTYDTPPAACKIVSVNSGTNPYSVQFSSNDFTITGGKRYRLTFRAKCSSPFTLSAIPLMKDASPWDFYSEVHTDWSATISTTWSVYTVEYTANATAGDAKINFLLGNALPAGATLYIDTVSFTEIQPPVMTQILGSSISWAETLYQDPVEVENAVRELAGKGFSTSWDASPGNWGNGLMENSAELAHCRKISGLLHKYGMGVSMGLSWPVLLPNQPEVLHETWVGEYLNPQTGRFPHVKSGPDEMRNWDFGSDEAKTAFVSRLAVFFQAVGPFETFFIDEMILADPGDTADTRQISTYWTSPTYSTRCLQSFRNYLAQKGYSGAGTAKFPVTTIAVPPSASCNMGLPAVAITLENRDRLTADNNWPSSVLWQHWYGWREDLLASWVHAATLAAYEACGQLPNWLGCTVGYPAYWYQPALGPNLDKLGDLQYVDYLVVGYCTGLQYAAVKQAAEQHNKKWGSTVQLCTYGDINGLDPGSILQAVKTEVNAGASVIMVYAGINFNQARSTPSANGLYYMPAQVAAWAEGINWLEQDKGYLRLGPWRLPGDANHDGKVDVGDLGILAANYGLTSGAAWGQGDFNADGKVDVGDLGILAANYGAGTDATADFNRDAQTLGLPIETEKSVEAPEITVEGCGLEGLPLLAGIVLAALGLGGLKFKG